MNDPVFTLRRGRDFAGGAAECHFCDESIPDVPLYNDRPKRDDLAGLFINEDIALHRQAESDFQMTDKMQNNAADSYHFNIARPDMKKIRRHQIIIREMAQHVANLQTDMAIVLRRSEESAQRVDELTRQLRGLEFAKAKCGEGMPPEPDESESRP